MENRTEHNNHENSTNHDNSQSSTLERIIYNISNVCSITSTIKILAAPLLGGASYFISDSLGYEQAKIVSAYYAVWGCFGGILGRHIFGMVANATDSKDSINRGTALYDHGYDV